VLRQAEVDVVLAGHRHVPYVWPVAGMLLIHSGTVSTLRTRGFPHPAYNLVHVNDGRIAVTLHVPGGEAESLGSYPRDWPAELSARHSDPFVRANAAPRSPTAKQTCCRMPPLRSAGRTNRLGACRQRHKAALSKAGFTMDECFGWRAGRSQLASMYRMGAPRPHGRLLLL
jgi:hypothetical protein